MPAREIKKQDEEDLVRKARKGEFPTLRSTQVEDLIAFQRACHALRANGIKFDERALLTRSRYKLAEFTRLRLLDRDGASAPDQQDHRIAAVTGDAPALLPPEPEPEGAQGELGGLEGGGVEGAMPESPPRRHHNDSEDEGGHPEAGPSADALQEDFDELLQRLRDDASVDPQEVEDLKSLTALQAHKERATALRRHFDGLKEACHKFNALAAQPQHKVGMASRLASVSAVLESTVSAGAAMAAHGEKTTEELIRQQSKTRHFEKPSFPITTSEHLNGATWLSCLLGATMVQHTDVLDLIAAHATSVPAAAGTAAVEVCERRLRDVKDIFNAALTNERLNNGSFPWQRITKSALEGLPEVVKTAYVQPNTGAGPNMWNDFVDQVDIAVRQHLRSANLMAQACAAASTSTMVVATVHATTGHSASPRSTSGSGGGGKRSRSWTASSPTGPSAPAAPPSTPSVAKAQPFKVEELTAVVKSGELAVKSLDAARRRASAQTWAMELVRRDQQYSNDGQEWLQRASEVRDRFLERAWRDLLIEEPFRPSAQRARGAPQGRGGGHGPSRRGRGGRGRGGRR